MRGLCDKCHAPVKDGYRFCYPCAYPDKARFPRRVPRSRDTILSLKCVAFKRVYLDVPFAEKQDVKRLGGVWDTRLRRWYVAPECSEARSHWREIENPIQPPKIAHPEPIARPAAVRYHLPLRVDRFGNVLTPSDISA